MMMMMMMMMGVSALILERTWFLPTANGRLMAKRYRHPTEYHS